MKKLKTEIIDELKGWGCKLYRTSNKLSKREIQAFYDIQKEAIASGIKDREIDIAIKLGRKDLAPKPRYDNAEVVSWI